MSRYFGIIVLLLLLISCSSTTVSGGSTTVESPYVIISVADSDLNMVAGTKVALYPETFNPLVDDTNSVRFGFSDDEGIVRLESIPVGTYSVIVMNDTAGAIIYPVLLTEEISDTISSGIASFAPARVHTSETAESVYFYGTPFVGDSKDNISSFSYLPQGKYPSLSIETSTEVVVKENIKIEGDTDIYEESGEIQLFNLDPGGNEDYPVSNFISVAAIDDKVWFGTALLGMWSFQGEAYERFVGGETSNFRNSILEIATGSPWNSVENPENLLIRTDGGTMHFRDNTGELVEQVLVAELGETRSNVVHMDSSGRCWVAFDTLVCHTTDSEEWSGRVQLKNVVAFAGDYDSQLYIGQRDGTITLLNSSGSSTVSISNPGSSLTLGVDPAGVLYVGTETGIYQLTGGIFSLIESTPSPVKKIVFDTVGALYALYGNNSILRKIGEGITHYRSLGGEGYMINDIAGSVAGEIYIAGGEAEAVRAVFQ